MKKLTIFIFFLLNFNASVHCQVQPAPRITPQLICFENNKKCFALEKILQTSKIFTVKKISNYKRLIIFPQQIDLMTFEQLAKNHDASPQQKRAALQQSAKLLNDNSVQSLKRILGSFYQQKALKNLQAIAINNALEVQISPQYIKWFDQFVVATKQLKLTAKTISSRIVSKASNDAGTNSLTSESKADLVVAIIDSGVSTKHQELQHLNNIKQFNPIDGSFALHDSALGHGTGVLSLVAGKNIVSDPETQMTQFLSCNGLPQGKYNFLNVLKCFDWLFMQPQVDIIMSPWLVDKAGCNRELLTALDMTWAANSFVIFPTGNYGANKSYSPANYRLYDGTPILSLGSVDKSGNLGKTSSFGVSACDNSFSAPTFVEAADSIKVAVPFTETSYQQVSGTSYAIALFARKLMQLMAQNPELSNQELYQILIDSGEHSKPKEAYGYGELDLKKAQQRLKEELKANQ